MRGAELERWERLAAWTGEVRAARRPPQGCVYDVTLLDASGGRFVVKTGDAPDKIAQLADEARVLGALADFRPVVPGFVARAGDDFLFTFVDGVDLATLAERASPPEREELAAGFGRLLRHIHGWTPGGVERPADWRGDAVRRCRANAEAGAFGPVLRRDFSPFDGWAMGDVLAFLDAAPPAEAETAFGHGDWCLPNVLAAGGRVTAAVDWSAGGYADPRFDLATGLWTLRRNGLPEYQETFLRAYGHAEPPDSLRWFEAVYAMI